MVGDKRQILGTKKRIHYTGGSGFTHRCGGDFKAGYYLSTNMTTFILEHYSIRQRNIKLNPLGLAMFSVERYPRSPHTLIHTHRQWKTSQTIYFLWGHPGQ